MQAAATFVERIKLVQLAINSGRNKARVYERAMLVVLYSHPALLQLRIHLSSLPALHRRLPLELCDEQSRNTRLKFMSRELSDHRLLLASISGVDGLEGG